MDAEVGMWTAVDPMGQYHNGYSFVGGDPINFIDRWGLEGESATPFYFPGDDLYIPSYPNQAAGMPTASNVQSNSFSSGSSGPGGGGVVYLSSFGSSGGGEASQRSAQSGQDRTVVRVAHEDELSPPDDGRIDVEKQEKIHRNTILITNALGPVSAGFRGGVFGFSAIRFMLGGGGKVLGKAERLKMVFDRLSGAPQAKTAKQAMDRMNSILDAVEDAHSGVSKNPNPGLMPDGRMYPAQADRTVTGADGTITATSRGHITTFGSNGSITVTDRTTGTLVFEKP